ncbi:MAG: uroporphyrinogen-III synthase [Cyanobacteria bacterium SZAS LIN-5]|nr:uroporphyrinogen-III synthase [Cyanobacteria bacterium SZAS LIN-5]
MKKTHPLTGISIVVTRAGHQASELTSRLTALGASVIELPTIEIVPPLSWDSVDTAIARIDEYDWIMFASTNAVQYFISRWAERPSGRMFTGKYATIGPSTTEALRRNNLNPSFQPSGSFVSEDFVDQFPGYPNLTGLKILWPRTNIGRDLIVEKFQAAGAEVDVVQAYQTVPASTSNQTVASLTEMLVRGQVDIITVASSQSVRNLAQILRNAFSIFDNSDASSLRQILRRTAIISIGPQTTATAVECLGKCEGQAEEFNLDGLINAVLYFVETNASE